MATVENTGEKLTPQLISTLAEPFQRGSQRIRTDHAGVGLGLAIVKSITQAHEGSLTLTPRAGGPLRHGATTRRATAHWQMTIRRIARSTALEGEHHGLYLHVRRLFQPRWLRRRRQQRQLDRVLG
jgi:signal transduction histidine kinase